jgi:hypothetical protein
MKETNDATTIAPVMAKIITIVKIAFNKILTADLAVAAPEPLELPPLFWAVVPTYLLISVFLISRYLLVYDSFFIKISQFRLVNGNFNVFEYFSNRYQIINAR